MQLASHPSFSLKLPSSHFSSVVVMPSPHLEIQVEAYEGDPFEQYQPETSAVQF